MSSPSPVSAPGLRSIAFDGSILVAVGDGGAIVNSALSWPSVAQWRLVFYDTDENQDSAEDNAAPQGDGVSNLVKYALGLDPQQNGSGKLPVGQVLNVPGTGSDYLTLTIDRNGVAPGITYVIEVSNNLSIWDSIPGTDTVFLSNTALLLKVRDNIPAADVLPPSRFIRLRITRP